MWRTATDEDPTIPVLPDWPETDRHAPGSTETEEGDDGWEDNFDDEDDVEEEEEETEA